MIKRELSSKASTKKNGSICQVNTIVSTLSHQQQHAKNSKNRKNKKCLFKKLVNRKLQKCSGDKKFQRETNKISINNSQILTSTRRKSNNKKNMKKINCLKRLQRASSGSRKMNLGLLDGVKLQELRACTKFCPLDCYPYI